MKKLIKWFYENVEGEWDAVVIPPDIYKAIQKYALEPEKKCENCSNFCKKA